MISPAFFISPKHPMQKKYEALRASFVENLSDADVAKKFDYSYYGFKTIKRDCKELASDYFFQPLHKGRPGGLSQKTIGLKDRIVELRKKNYSIVEIKEKLEKEGFEISDDPIIKILHDEGFVKLFQEPTMKDWNRYRQTKNIPKRPVLKNLAIRKSLLPRMEGYFYFFRY